ncbi:unnamed protein product [Mytilus coruscus]|uniref:Interferon-induced protein 44-like n=1 Tax=Mytilus coruscus TaxID=42192 RepID=A0A6J8AWD3_MYTCO|nr:unnamed protein product [Mytilus coruscus]
MPVADSSYSIYDIASQGPSFGSGHDLLEFTSTVVWSGTYFQSNGYVTPGNAYSANGETSDSIISGSKQLKEIEVYLVEGNTILILASYNTSLDGQLCMYFEELKEKVERYKPMKELKVPQARVLLVGQVGAGKTSFFNTINSVFRGYITRQACSVSNVMYQIRNSVSWKALNFRLHDIRGLEADQGMDAHGMCYLLDGIPQIVLLTKIDKVCEASSEDLSQVFFSPVVQETVDRFSQILGLPRSNILPIKNYESEIELQDNVNILTLLTLQQILNSADDYMFNYLDQIEDGKLQQLNIRE